MAIFNKTSPTLSRRPNKKNHTRIKLFINGEALLHEDSIRYLGVYIDNHLNLNCHFHPVFKYKTRLALPSVLWPFGTFAEIHSTHPDAFDITGCLLLTMLSF